MQNYSSNRISANLLLTNDQILKGSWEMAKITQYSAANLIAEAGVDPHTWNAVPSDEILENTVKAIESRGIKVTIAGNADDALAVLKKVIPEGSEVMTGSSTTLIEIGYEDYISGNLSRWKLMHTIITAENNDNKRAELRRKSVAAEYFISSANAIAQTGEIVACDASGSRIGAWPFAAGHLILVVGINKIVPNLEAALTRVREYAYPLENTRAKRAYGTPSVIGKCVILSHEKNEGRVLLILVREALGY
jgi:L-lactate utilization protein LutC